MKTGWHADGSSSAHQRRLPLRLQLSKPVHTHDPKGLLIRRFRLCAGCHLEPFGEGAATRLQQVRHCMALLGSNAEAAVRISGLSTGRPNVG